MASQAAWSAIALRGDPPPSLGWAKRAEAEGRQAADLQDVSDAVYDDAF
jgi:hypothetical protein